MAKIIAGRFDATIDADAAVERLKLEGFERDELDCFYVSPPGQHDMTPVGGDVHASAGSRFAWVGAVIGAIAGAALGFVVAWLVADSYRTAALLFGAALGAYVGSFLGTMGKLRGGRRSEASVEHPLQPKAGRMIAVKADRPGADQRAVKVLRELGARDVGRAEGNWRNGWKDFDPRAPLMTP
ncbi:MAG TPA: hypothetical protein VFZ84_11110 [Burkholderiales bacterium]